MRGAGGGVEDVLLWVTPESGSSIPYRVGLFAGRPVGPEGRMQPGSFFRNSFCQVIPPSNTGVLVWILAMARALVNSNRGCLIPGAQSVPEAKSGWAVCCSCNFPLAGGL